MIRVVAGVWDRFFFAKKRRRFLALPVMPRFPEFMLE